MRHLRWLSAELLIVVTSLLLFGCAGSDVGKLITETHYQGRLFDENFGFRDKQLAPDRYEVEVAGKQSAPWKRLEKIAMARAAEIGVEQKFSDFEVTARRQDFVCFQSRKYGSSRGGMPLLTFTVQYSSHLTSTPTNNPAVLFKKLRDELEVERSSEEDKEQMNQLVLQVCANSARNILQPR